MTTLPPLPEPGEASIEEHVYMSRRFIPLAKRELEAGRRLQASEKTWGAAAHALKAIALQRGWQHKGHATLLAIADQLGKEFGDPDLSNHASIMDSMHTNFYENRRLVDAISSALDDAEAFLDKLDEIRNSSPRPFTVADDNDRISLGLVLGVRRGQRPPIGSYSNVGFSRNHDDPEPGAFPVSSLPIAPEPSGGAEASIPAPDAFAEPPEGAGAQASAASGTPGPEFSSDPQAARMRQEMGQRYRLEEQVQSTAPIAPSPAGAEPGRAPPDPSPATRTKHAGARPRMRYQGMPDPEAQAQPVPRRRLMLRIGPGTLPGNPRADASGRTKHPITPSKAPKYLAQ